MDKGKDKNEEGEKYMRYVYLKKTDLGEFIDLLKKNHKVVAPVKKENKFVFAEVDSADEISMEYTPTILPPKKYFFPQHEYIRRRLWVYY